MRDVETRCDLSDPAVPERAARLLAMDGPTVAIAEPGSPELGRGILHAACLTENLGHVRLRPATLSYGIAQQGAEMTQDAHAGSFVSGEPDV